MAICTVLHLYSMKSAGKEFGWTEGLQALNGSGLIYDVKTVRDTHQRRSVVTMEDVDEVSDGQHTYTR